jgi:hypothetical protein
MDIAQNQCIMCFQEIDHYDQNRKHNHIVIIFIMINVCLNGLISGKTNQINTLVLSVLMDKHLHLELVIFNSVYNFVKMIIYRQILQNKINNILLIRSLNTTNSLYFIIILIEKKKLVCSVLLTLVNTCQKAKTGLK